MTIGLTGVDCWHEKRSTALHPDLAGIQWNGRSVFIVFDSDAADNENVKANESLLAAALQLHGAKVRVVRLPVGPSGEKAVLDDYLVVHGHDLRKLLDDAEDPEPPDPGSLKQAASEIFFESEAERMLEAETKDGLSRLRFWSDGFWHWRGRIPQAGVVGDVSGITMAFGTRRVPLASRQTWANVAYPLAFTPARRYFPAIARWRVRGNNRGISP